MNGKAAEVAIYPQKLCVEILKGLRDTAIEDDFGEGDGRIKQESEFDQLACPHLPPMGRVHLNQSLCPEG